MTARSAVFLDRDGTLIEDRHYLRDPEAVTLLPGAAAAVRRLNDAGVAAVVVTNQSGIARGLLTESEYLATAERLEALLAREHAHLDGAYHCPHLPEITGPCECRKPGLLLYQQAARELQLDLHRSWWVGDRARDLEASLAWSGRGILLDAAGSAADPAPPSQGPWLRAPILLDAVDRILTGAL